MRYVYACRPGEARGQTQLSFLGVIYSFALIFVFGVCNRLPLWPGTCQELQDRWMAIWSIPGVMLSLFHQNLTYRHHQPSIFLFYNFGILEIKLRFSRCKVSFISSSKFVISSLSQTQFSLSEVLHNPVATVPHDAGTDFVLR